MLLYLRGKLFHNLSRLDETRNMLIDKADTEMMSARTVILDVFDTGDPADFELGDCATQRNLSAAGRAEARAIGQRFRAPLAGSGGCAFSRAARSKTSKQPMTFSWPTLLIFLTGPALFRTQNLLTRSTRPSRFRQAKPEAVISRLLMSKI